VSNLTQLCVVYGVDLDKGSAFLRQRTSFLHRSWHGTWERLHDGETGYAMAPPQYSVADANYNF
jgi:hypothetical protein